MDSLADLSLRNRDRVHQHLNSRFLGLVEVEEKQDAGQPAVVSSPDTENYRARLPDVTMTLTTSNSIMEEEARIANLFEALCQVKKRTAVSKGGGFDSLSPEAALGAIDMFFTRCFRRPGLLQLECLCREASEGDEWRGIQRARPVAEPGMPAILKDFYDAYEADSEAPPRRTQALARLLRYAKKVEFYKRYAVCREALEGRDIDQELVGYMMTKGFSVGGRRSLVTCFHQLVSKQFQFNMENWAEKRYVGAVLSSFVDTFGYGILPLLPGGALKL